MFGPQNWEGRKKKRLSAVAGKKRLQYTDWLRFPRTTQDISVLRGKLLAAECPADPGIAIAEESHRNDPGRKYLPLMLSIFPAVIATFIRLDGQF